MKEASDIINQSVVFIPSDLAIEEAVKIMVDQQISSVLVHDHNDQVVGIITERDIFRKFLLLDVKDKMQRKVNAVMTRPVQFVRMPTFREEAVKLHLQYNIRHFPILKGNEPLIKNVLGIVSLSDLFRFYVDQQTFPSEPIASSQPAPTGGKANFQDLYLLCKKPEDMRSYRELFVELGYHVHLTADLNDLLKLSKTPVPALMVDMDYYSQKELHDIIASTSRYQGGVIMTSRNVSLISLLRKFQKAPNRLMAVKPLDISYVHWLLSYKWREHNPDVGKAS